MLSLLFSSESVFVLLHMSAEFAFFIRNSVCICVCTIEQIVIYVYVL